MTAKNKPDRFVFASFIAAAIVLASCRSLPSDESSTTEATSGTSTTASSTTTTGTSTAASGTTTGTTTAGWGITTGTSTAASGTTTTTGTSTAGWGTTGTSTDAGAMAAHKPRYVTTSVYFATDRDYAVGPEGGEFGIKRSNMRYGTCVVSIPMDHRVGVVESPSWWTMGLVSEDAAKHIVVQKTLVQSEDVFFTAIAQRAHRKNAFVFVHGFDTSFSDAAKRTAQMAYDLKFEGAPVFFSWPSRGSIAPWAYSRDEDSVQWAETHLEKFLADFFDKSKADHIYLIAHSMGNRALTRALTAVLRNRPNVTKRFTEVILTAPDIDAEVFRTQIAPALTASRWPITLYASSDDVALEASKAVHGDPRAGDAGADLVVFPGIDTIDATSVDTGLLGHSYYAENRSVLSDLYYLIRDGKPPDGRFGLRRVDTKRGHYWIFVH